MKEYNIPLELFTMDSSAPSVDEAFEKSVKREILNCFCEHKVRSKIRSARIGVTVTTICVALEQSLSPRRCTALKNDLAERLGTDKIRFVVNNDKGVMDIEIPNKKRTFVGMGEFFALLKKHKGESGALQVAMGKDTQNNLVVKDLAKMVHTLIAGSSGTGKSVLLGAMITSLLYQYSPKEVQLILIDPKKVEFAIYSGLPHVVSGEPITDIVKTVDVLNEAIAEMNRRYALFEKVSTIRKNIFNLDEYNQCVGEEEKLPKIVIVIDELADLMLCNKREVEICIQALAQKARAAGIILVVATQRPSVSVVTGVIKASLPTRIAFAVPTSTDSRCILDNTDAQVLLGWGDYLYSNFAIFAPVRMQAPFISYEDIKKLTEYIITNYSA